MSKHPDSHIRGAHHWGMEFRRSRLLVLYASETGTAEDVAFKVHQMLQLQCTHQLEVVIKRMDDYDVLELPDERLVIFVTSTGGDGEVPWNMKSFWSFLLRRALAGDSLAAMRYTVFGLGDSAYDKFNAAARRLNSRLKQLGASELAPMGLGDDQARAGFFTAFDIWIAATCAALCAAGLTTSGAAARVVQDEPAHYSVGRVVGSGSSGSQLFYRPPPDCKHGDRPLQATVMHNERMTRHDWQQDVRHIVMDISAARVELGVPAADPLFIAGDVAVIHPINGDAEVALMLNVLQRVEPDLQLSTVLEIKCLHSLQNCRKNRIAADMTLDVQSLLTRYLDISGIPQRSFFEQLARFAGSGEEREKLLELSCGEGSDLFVDYCTRERRTYTEVLADFRSTRVRVEQLLELLPPLPPRHYSIASSGLAHSSEVHLCVALVDYRTRYGRRKIGVCSNYFSLLQPGDPVALWIRRGSFPSSAAERPLILVGPGTGLAPMRAMLQERLRLPCAEPRAFPHTMLFFGCRRRACDYLYGSELESVEQGSGGRSVVLTAFSQDQEQKEYVTHLIRKNAGLVWQSLSSGAAVCVAGSAKSMPRDVRAALRDVAATQGGMDLAAAEALLTAMERQGRYFVEAWS